MNDYDGAIADCEEVITQNKERALRTDFKIIARAYARIGESSSHLSMVVFSLLPRSHLERKRGKGRWIALRWAYQSEPVESTSICSQCGTGLVWCVFMINTGTAYVKKKELTKAIEAFENSLLETHDNKVYDKLRETKKMLKDEEEKAYRSEEKSKEERQAGNEFFKAGKFPQAIER